jgi:hypothetical protein
MKKKERGSGKNYYSLKFASHDHTWPVTHTTPYNPDNDVTVDQTPTELVESKQPNLIITNKKTMHAVIIDMAITGQRSPDCLQRKRQAKIDKYADIAKQHEDLGYKVTLDAVVFGDVGGTDKHNEELMHLIGASPRYAQLMHRFCVASVLRHGHKIWVTRCHAQAALQ